MRAFRFVIVVCAAVAALGFVSGLACAPDSFEGIVGGSRDAGEAEAPTELRPDENLPAPRPIAPYSVSWVNATRVRFRWELAQGTTGARIELCRTRDCEGDGEKKTFDAEGSELLTPEDLAVGFWFWRLYGKTAEAIGTKPSACWELLVRGGQATNGSGTGAIADVNGDGAPDLLVTLELEPIGADGGTEYELLPLLGVKEDPTRFALPIVLSPDVLFAAPRTGVAVGDIDGDGFSDLTWTFADSSRAEVLTSFGSAEGTRPGVSFAITPPLSETPNLREAGDVDLDGWGDVVVSTRRDIFVVRGTAAGPGPILYGFQLGTLDVDGGVPVPSAPMAIGAGHVRDEADFFEMAFAWPLPDETPVAYLLPGLPLGVAAAPVDTGPPPKRGATAFADGDFDGGGVTDTAFATTIDGAPAVCILRVFGVIGPPASICWPAPAPAPPGFASSMTAGDLDADGRDELIVGSTANGMWILRLSDGEITAEHLDVPYGAYVTTIHPGRPGPAVWAATQASGADIAIFRGTSQSATIPLPDFAKSFGPTIR